MIEYNRIEVSKKANLNLLDPYEQKNFSIGFGNPFFWRVELGVLFFWALLPFLRMARIAVSY